jgi:hypothetical protein
MEVTRNDESEESDDRGSSVVGGHGGVGKRCQAQAVCGWWAWLSG